MALKQIYENNAASYISQQLGGTTGDTSIFIIGADAPKFPEPEYGVEFYVGTIENVQTKDWEIVRVIRKVDNQFTVVRGQEGSTIKIFPVGSKFQIRVTKETLERLYNQAGSISSFVHEQETLSNSWIVNHNLNRIPNVTIEIGAWVSGVFTKTAEAEAEITHTSSNSFIITFSENTIGRAICS